MKVSLERRNNAFHFEAFNEDKVSIHIDGSPEIGGENKGVRPMQLLLMGAAGCSAIDIGLILQKQKQEIVDWKIDVSAKRKKMGTYSIFESILIDYKFVGDLDEKKVERAIKLSLEKYCSVSKTLEYSAKIDYQFSIERS